MTKELCAQGIRSYALWAFNGLKTFNAMKGTRLSLSKHLCLTKESCSLCNVCRYDKGKHTQSATFWLLKNWSTNCFAQFPSWSSLFKLNVPESAESKYHAKNSQLPEERESPCATCWNGDMGTETPSFTESQMIPLCASGLEARHSEISSHQAWLLPNAGPEFT